jgi:hypothetical protein
LTRRSQALRRESAGREPGIALLASVLLTGCTDAAGYDLDYILSRAPFIATMRTRSRTNLSRCRACPRRGACRSHLPPATRRPPFTQAQLDSVGAR